MGRPLFGSTHIENCLCPKCTADTDPSQLLQVELPQLQTQPSSVIQPTGDLLPDPQGLPASILQTISESQASLNRASSVIEAAYQRLLALRTRLRQNSEAMSLLSQLGPSPRMGPHHSAIVLSDPQQSPAASPEGASDMVVDQDSQTPDAMSTPSESAARTLDTIRRRFQELAGSDRSAPALPEHAPYSDRSDPSHTPRPSSAITVIRPASIRPGDGDTFYFNVYSRHDANPSDPATTLGRRVEARAAASRNVSRSADDTATRIMELRSSIDSYISRLNRHGEELLAAASSLRQDGRTSSEAARSAPQASAPRPAPSVTGYRRLTTAPQLREEMDIGTRRARDDLDVRSWTGPASSDPMFTPSSSTIPTAPRSATRLSERVSGDMIQSYLPAPRPSMRSRRRGDGERNPARGSDAETIFRSLIDLSDSDDDEDFEWLLSDRRRRIRPPVGGLDSSRLRSDMLGRARAALLTGRTPHEENNNGFAQTTQPRASQSSWFGFQEQFDVDASASQSGGVTSNGDSARTRRRRRGWARLDRDGNEIPTDEEEEYERNRAHMRARAQALSGGSSVLNANTEAVALPPPPPAHQRFSYVFSPTTRTDLSPDTSQSHDPSTIRVRLSSRNRDDGESSRPARTRIWNQQNMQRETETLVVPVRAPSASSSFGDTSCPFEASLLPWATIEYLPASTRVKERSVFDKVQASTRPPAAGR